MPRKRTRQLTTYLLPEELRKIRLAAANADAALSSFVRDVMLKHVAARRASSASIRAIRRSARWLNTSVSTSPISMTTLQSTITPPKIGAIGVRTTRLTSGPLTIPPERAERAQERASLTTRRRVAE
jgi:hypothetical protein